MSWDTATAAKPARDLSVWFCCKVRRALYLRGLRTLSSHLIYWGTPFCGASPWWGTPLWPKGCGGHRQRGFLAQWLLTSVIPVPTLPLLQTPPARAGSEKSELMKSQVLWVWVFPSIYAALLQNMQVKFCQTLLSYFNYYFGWLVVFLLGFLGGRFLISWFN